MIGTTPDAPTATATGTTGSGATSRPWWRRPSVVIAVVLTVVLSLVVVALGALVVREVSRGTPDFPSLAAHPDPSLHGTVAYLADQTGCVRVVAAAGAPAKDVLCLPGQDPERGKALGKEVGPQLVWRPDGRLEVTMFRMTDPPGPSFRPGWQKVVDVRTGAVEDVPESEAPTAPNLATHPKVNASGQRIDAVTSDHGHVEVVLTDAAGSRPLLAADGHRDYRLLDAFWAPDGQWVAADDGRIIVITTGEPAVTRVLTDESSSIAFGGEDPRVARFAITSADLLTA